MATNPLSNEQIAQLRELQKAIPAQKEAIRKAKAVGVDVSQAEKDLLEHEKQLQMILANYG